jgi:hypothetical protein
MNPESNPRVLTGTRVQVNLLPYTLYPKPLVNHQL